jgi:hypothetical protein
MGTFLVTERGGIQNSNQTDTNPYYDVLHNSFVRSGIEGDQM